MLELSWSHHALIQALFSRGPLKEDQFHLIFMGVTGKNPNSHQRVFSDYLLKINKALSFAQFELRCCRDQYDGQIYYGIVNTISDEHSKMGTKYSVPQIAFYKAVVEALVQDVSAQAGLSNIDALHLRLENQVLTETGSQSQSDVPPAFKNFSISQKEKTLHDLVQDQWLSSTADGHVKLGVRSFLDLRSWFRSNDIPSCEVCNEAGVKAELCPNEACTVRVHHYCVKKIPSKRKGEKVCPSCSTSWPRTVPKGEVIDEENEPELPTQSPPASGSKRKRHRINNTGDVNAIVSGCTSTSQPNSDRRRTTRSSARPR